MGGNKFVPSGDAPFLSWGDNLVTYAQSRLSDWGIPQDAWGAMMASKSVFETKYALLQNPQTRTPVAIEEKTEARRDYEKKLREIIKACITYNFNVTNGDRVAMQLPIHDNTRTPIPAPVKHVILEIVQSGIRTLTLKFHEEGSESRAIPYGMDGAVISWDVPEAPPADPAALTHSALATRSPFAIEFAEAQRGKRAYIAARWQNRKGQTGPYSEIASELIP